MLHSDRLRPNLQTLDKAHSRSGQITTGRQVGRKKERPIQTGGTYIRRHDTRHKGIICDTLHIKTVTVLSAAFLFIVMLNVVMLNVIILNVGMLNVVMLNVVMLIVICHTYGQSGRQTYRRTDAAMLPIGRQAGETGRQ